MIYGYIQKCDDTGYDLISPKQMIEINLSSAALSTFILSGTRLSIFKWLEEYGTVEVKVEDPLEPSRVPTMTIEIRRKANFFFSRNYVIIRPTISADMIKGAPTASDPALDANFRLPLVKKLILPAKNSFKEILQYLKLGNAHSSIVKSMATASPSSYYDPALTEITIKAARVKRMSLKQKMSYPDSLSDSKPSLCNSSYFQSFSGDTKLDQELASLNNNFSTQKPLTRSSTMTTLPPGIRNRTPFEPTLPNFDQKPYSVAMRAIIKCEYGVRRTRSLAK